MSCKIPAVSVIVPAYNAEKFLRQCLDSLIYQTLRNIEIIVVNDGSTDLTKFIANEYARKDTRIRIINQENKGLGAARNAGLKAAKGIYVSFIDSDDWVAKDFLSKLYQCAKYYNADITMSNLVRAIPNNGGFRYRYFVEVTKSLCTSDTLAKYRIADVPRSNYIVNKLYRRDSLIQNDMYFEEGRLFEDIEWSTKVIAKLSILATIANANYYYRYNDISLMIGDSERGYRDYHIAQQKALMFRHSLDLPIEHVEYYEWSSKVTYRLLGLPLITIEDYRGKKLYYIFGKLKVN